MRSAAQRIKLSSLTHDALYEIASRLPAVGSATPWRDLNSLSSTCRKLAKWKRRHIETKLKLEWGKASEKFSGANGWWGGLQAIFEDFKDPSIRLFREPVLRKAIRICTEADADSRTLQHASHVVTLYSKREAVTLKELRQCLDACKDVGKRRKLELLSRFPSFMQTLNSAERVESLRLIFKWLDTDAWVDGSKTARQAFDDMRDVLMEDGQAKAALDLGLIAHGWFSVGTTPLDVLDILSRIPIDKRWQWVSGNVPGLYCTAIGLRGLLMDPVCQLMVADKWKNAIGDVQRWGVASCKLLSGAYKELARFREGRKLIKQIGGWLVKEPVSKYVSQATGCPNKEYVHLLVSHLPKAEAYLGTGVKKTLKKALCEAFAYAVVAKDFRRSTHILLNLAKDDSEELASKLHRIPRAFWKSENRLPALKHALQLSYTLPSSRVRADYIRILVEISDEWPEIDASEVDAFRASARKILDVLNNTKGATKDREDEGEHASES